MRLNQGPLLVEGLRAAFWGSPVWEAGVWFGWFWLGIVVVVDCIIFVVAVVNCMLVFQKRLILILSS